MYIFKERSNLKRFLRYSFFVILFLFLIISIWVFYDYVRNSSEHVVSKWWTYIEWLTSSTSYLPYLNTDPQSYFYQSLLFRSCMDFQREENWQVVYTPDLCNVETQDNQNYTVTLKDQVSWSNWVPMSINDLFFTFQDIIALNKLDFSWNEIRNGTEVTQESDVITVTFPTQSSDNMLFFTNHILPKHVLLEPNIDMYKQDFGRSPVYNWCAKIQEQSKDIYSLIFDLSECSDSNIAYYQLKQIGTIDDFAATLEWWKWSIIDTYIWSQTLTWYSKQELMTDKYAILFFNTDSNNMLVRTRRALWWFIKYNLDFSNTDLFHEYDWTLFNQFWSTWTNLEDFIELSAWDSISRKSLMDSWVWEIPEEISIRDTNRAFLYYVDEFTDSAELNLSFAWWNYPELWIKYMDWDVEEVDNYDDDDRTATYEISIEEENLQPGNNTYAIYGINWNKEDRLSTINIYKIPSASEIAQDDTNQINVIYLDNDYSKYIINSIRELLKQEWVIDSFDFETVDSLADLETKTLIWDYDIVLGIVDSSMKEWFYKFITSDSVLINPTNYTNPMMSSLLKEYESNNNDSGTIQDINELYANDMPFVVLSTEKAFVNIKDTILQKLEDKDLFRHEYNWQQNIYNNLSLTENIYIDNNVIWSFENFKNYILAD